MRHIQSILQFIRSKEGLILSFLLHVLVLVIFMYTTYYIPKLNEERAAASILFEDEGGVSDRLKYQDRSLVDKMR